MKPWARPTDAKLRPERLIYAPHVGLGIKKRISWDFPGGTVVKNPPANAGDTGLSPGLGRSHMPWSN